MENLILQILEGKNMNLVPRVETCHFLEWEDKHSEGFKILRFEQGKIWPWLKTKDSDDFWYQKALNFGT